jgi:hypothetical protein
LNSENEWPFYDDIQRENFDNKMFELRQKGVKLPSFASDLFEHLNKEAQQTNIDGLEKSSQYIDQLNFCFQVLW